MKQLHLHRKSCDVLDSTTGEQVKRMQTDKTVILSFYATVCKLSLN